MECKNSTLDPSENKDVLMKIISKQKLGGYWEANAELISLLGLKSDKIFGQTPEEIKSKDIWITILIIYYFEIKFPKSQGSWKLISQKAEEYLEDNNVSYAFYKDKALELIK